MAVDQYITAVHEGRLEDAYKMLSTESRADLTFAAFKKLILENPDEVAALLAALEQEAAPPSVRATITTKKGEELVLIYENGAWKVDESAVDLYSQADPRQCIASFVRAYDHKRYDILLLFVPDSQKEGLTAEILKESWEGEQQLELELIVEGLRTHMATAPIDVLGNRATMSYGAGGSVELLQEHGTWKIEDFQ